jgi:Tfp pilus assembly protein PilX
MALIFALMAMLLMVALGTALVLTTTTESRIVKNFRNSTEATYVADAALEMAMNDLLTVPDWNTLLAGTVTSAFIDGAASGTRTMADGTSFDLSEVRNRANCNKVTTCSDSDMNAITGERPWGLNNPRWQLYAYGPVNNLLPTDTINSPFYVIVMVGDDPSESDNDPLHDGVVACNGALPGNPPTCNPGTGVLGMRAEAFGPFGTHSVIELTIGRTDTTELERGYTGQRGQDEQNRRARKAAVQSPGKSLTRTELTTSTGAIQ